jgi:beta-glucosidase
MPGRPSARVWQLPERGSPLRGPLGDVLVTANVRNAGDREGDEVVQVYASRDGAKWPEPSRKLVAFQRIHLRAGERRAVSLLIGRRDLAQADGEGNLTIVPGRYRFSIGGGIPGQEPATSGRCVVSEITMPKLAVGR